MTLSCPRRLAIAVCTSIALLAAPVLAQDDDEEQGPNPAEIAADLIVYRTLSLIQTVLGAACLVPVAPIAYFDGRFDEVYDMWVREPFDYTFTRPLGRP